MRDSKQDILNFWFNECDPSYWFDHDESFDDEITDRFFLTYEMICEGLGDEWGRTSDGALALCLVLNQFPRRIFRSTQRMFATDLDAIAVARNAIQLSLDDDLIAAKKTFLYLPFSYSEKATDQHTSLALFEPLKDQELIAYDHICQRAFAIEQFGRFPRRNEVLARANTKKEALYLQSLSEKNKTVIL